MTKTPPNHVVLSRIFPLCVLCLLAPRSGASPRDYFRISVTDSETGRGVPLVELRTTNDVLFVTDSNGIAAVGDPELLGQKVYFSVKSHGYEFPKDGLGYAGTAFSVAAGGQGEIKIKRLNIAERLYRITGAGIYRDSVLVGLPTPIQHPLTNGLVMGQDTVEAEPYRGKLFWLWGDTSRFSYPLGNFKTSSATSALPGPGGFDPSKGIDLTYFVDQEGFSKEMIPMPTSKPVWMGTLFTLRDAQNRERLFGAYANVLSDSAMSEHGLAMFNDEKAIFEKVRAFDTPLFPGGHPFRVTSGGKNYLYFDPFQRVLADIPHVLDGKTYQAFTPLVAGTKFDGKNTQLERSPSGQLVYAWKTNTAKLGSDEVKKLVEAGAMKADEAPTQLRDIETDAPIRAHGASTYWNPYRGRWVQIFSQAIGSSSYLGELWFAEADTPTGPWVYARKIITHDKYTFYNPIQHPNFAQDGGRLIYLEGTYTDTYSGAPEKTPRYNYNQMMYRVALDDPRLALPVPVYHLKNGAGYALRDVVVAKSQQIESIPFFALPPSAQADGQIAIYAVGNKLQTQTAAGGKPIFTALANTAMIKSSAIVPLYEYSQGQKRWYSINGEETGTGIVRSEAPLCRVWRNPSTSLSLDWEAKAVVNSTSGK